MKPHSPLPWTIDGYYIRDAKGSATFANEQYYPWVEEKDYPYIVHAANAYPRMIAVLRQIATPALGGKAQQYAAQAILAELGEQ